MIKSQKNAKISLMENRLDSLMQANKGDQPQVSQEFRDLVDQYKFSFQPSQAQSQLKQYTKSDIYQRFNSSLFKRAQTPKSRMSTQSFLTSKENKGNQTLIASKDKSSQVAHMTSQREAPFIQKLEQDNKQTSTKRPIQMKLNYDNMSLEQQNSKIEKVLPVKKLIDLYSIVDNMNVQEFKQLPTLYVDKLVKFAHAVVRKIP